MTPGAAFGSASNDFHAHSDGIGSMLWAIPTCSMAVGYHAGTDDVRVLSFMTSVVT